MAAGARLRALLVGLPMTAAVVWLLVTGVWYPRLIDPGPGPAVYLGAVLVVGSLSALPPALAALRSRSRLRLSWAALSAAVVLWTATLAGALLGWNQVLVWGGLRTVTFAAMGVSVLTAPGVRRSANAWGLLLLDGWLIGASVFIVGWVALALAGSPPTGSLATVPPALYWVPVDLLVASVTAGLAMRTDPGARGPVALLVLACLLAVTGDTTWALTRVPEFPTVQWLVMAVALGCSGVFGRLDVWTSRRPEPARPQLTRLSQVAVVPGLVAALLSPSDLVTVGVALSVIVVLAFEILLAGRTNHDLWLAMQRQTDRLDQLVSESKDAIVQVGRTGLVEFANDAAADVLGRGPDSLLDVAAIDLVHPADRREALDGVARLDRGQLPSVRVGGRFLHGDGEWRHLEAIVSRRTGDGRGYTLSARDVSERVRLEAELRRLACTDALTGLLNRQAFLNQLDQRLLDGEMAVLFIDLDGFKTVNDMQGHAVGDRLLGEVASALSAQLRPGDLVARLGGDEFAVCTSCRGVERVHALTRRVVERLHRMPSEAAQPTSASVGVAIGHRTTAEALLGDADLAMYEAKAIGGQRYVMFDPGLRERVVERARMSVALERVCRDEGLLLDLQPIVAMVDGRWTGFEALTRWQDGDRRRLPGEFLALAEETGLIVPIGSWVLRESLAWLAGWPDPDIGISVNIAGRQVVTPGFADLVRDQLAVSGVSPHRLTLEITEQTAVEDLERAGAVLQPLRSLGVHVALDDFGTGFSSLGYLAQLPIDELKIDRRFVAGLGVRDEDDALVRVVIGLAADLGLRVVAEGVETQDQARTLLEWGCGLAQGYRFGRPMPIDTVPRPQPGPVPMPAHEPRPQRAF